MHPSHRHVRVELTTLLLLAVLFTAGCYVRPAEGAFPCVTAADCPGGWVCRADELCWSTDDAACPTGQHFERSLAECREDLDAPVIHIAPVTPRTLDDLSVVIDTPTVETLRPGAGPITYRYEWSRDGAAVTGETTAGIDAELTTRDEVWRVEVTPITDDGLEGPMTMAMVTIANTPPVLTTVGLSSYAPIVGETLQMLPGPASDLDGDTLTYDFEWRNADGSVIAGTTTAFLTTFVADAQIIGAARVHDSTDAGEWVIVGPVTSLADETRWRALLPQREIGTEGWVVHDVVNDRVVVFAPSDRLMNSRQVWEFPLHGNDRFVELFPQGDAPRFAWSGRALDTVNHRVLMFGGGDRSTGLDGDLSSRVFALELARGRERWVELHPSGTEPTPRFGAQGTFDPGGSRALFFGGITGGATFSDEVWALDVAVAGSERWSSIARTGFPLFSPTVVRDEPRERWLILAGNEATDLRAFALTDDDAISLVPSDLTGFHFGSVPLVESDGEHRDPRVWTCARKRDRHERDDEIGPCKRLDRGSVVRWRGTGCWSLGSCVSTRVGQSSRLARKRQLGPRGAHILRGERDDQDLDDGSSR